MNYNGFLVGGFLVGGFLVDCFPVDSDEVSFLLGREVLRRVVRPEVGFQVGVVGRLVLGRLVLGREVGRAVVGCADMVGAHVTPGMTR